MICGSGGSKSRLAKAADAEPAGHRSDEKLHAVVAGSTFPSQNVQNTSAPDHFWKLRCQKNARRCGAKHISGPLLEVSKKCTPLWREAHFQVKKNVPNTPFSDHFWKSRCWKSARRCGANHILKSKVLKTGVSDHLWKLRCRKSVRRCGGKHISKSKCTKHTILGPLLEVQMLKRCTPLWREAHLEVKMSKTLGFGPFLEVQMLKKCTPLWREAHFWSHTTLQYSRLQYTPLH